MSDVFGPGYADAYDLLYSDKDYEVECDIIESTARAHGLPDRLSILDLGCGTGRHAVVLAERGHRVTGVDLSPSMLAQAQSRASTAGVAVDFAVGDVRSVRLGNHFDVVLMMFAVLGYQHTDADVVRALQTVEVHLGDGGLFLFDVWYGPAVESVGPSVRTKTIAVDEGEIERTASGRLEGDGTCTVEYELIRRERGRVLDRIAESHRMRYFFAEELAARLQGARLEMSDLRAFPEMTKPTVETWNAFVVATRR
jgi:SAM-dependent methyltransferase